MAVFEGEHSALNCVKCDAPFSPVGQFCTSCGAPRAVALGQEIDPEEAARRAAEEEAARLAAEEEASEQARILAEEKRAERAQARKEFLERNKLRLRIAAAAAALAAVYLGVQYWMFSSTPPTALVDEYVAAVTSRDTAALSDSRLFPAPEGDFEIAPAEVLAAVSAPSDEAKYTIDWSPFSAQATAKLWGSSLQLVSDDQWSFIFRKHQWRIASPAPTVQLKARAGMSAEVSAGAFGSVDYGTEDLEALALQPAKYVVLPGEFTLSTDGVGFTSDWTSGFWLRSGDSVEAEFGSGDLSLPPAAITAGRNSANKAFRRCGNRNYCGNYLTMSDFDIDYPWYYEDYSVDDDTDYDGCTFATEYFDSSTSSTAEYDCSASVSRAVTWLIASYYFLPDEYDFDWGTAYFSARVKVRLNYVPATGKVVVKKVTVD